MLKKLRREFIAITMSIVGVVLFLALASTVIGTYQSQQETIRQSLERALVINDVGGPDRGGTTGDLSAGVITVAVSADGVITRLGDPFFTLDDQTLIEVVGEVVQSTESTGTLAAYSLTWMREDLRGGWRIAFATTIVSDAALKEQVLSAVRVFVCAMAVLFVVVWLLARWILKPVEEAWDRQRRFVSDASHELKTPLAVILANAQILETDKELPTESRRWVMSTKEEATHMKDLVEDLLTLARADEREAMGQTTAPIQENVDLTGLVSGCALEFDAVAFERGCTIACDLADDVSVSGDKDQLGRLVRTLLDNATKYAETGSEVMVKLSREGSRAHLLVNNKGEVIAGEDLDHIFDRFYRTDEARERQAEGGFGLGLAIAKSIVVAHGGEISATSTAEDGTTFTVLL